jgi:SAM-dependent methyltransferase
VEAAHWWYAATRALLQDLLGPHLGPASRVLDAGCGTGATGGWLGDGGHDVVGVDAVAEALALHRGAHRTRGLVLGDLARLPFADASFDAALCVTVLYHEALPDPAVAVRELGRVVRPGGVLCLLEPGVRALRRAHDRVTHAARRFARADLVALARDAGLDVERATGAYAFLVPPAAAKAVLERGRTGSDLDEASGGLGGVLPALARAERALLRRASLPAGLSVAVVARRPGTYDRPFPTRREAGRG